jgi:hypothetical protein
MGTPASQGAFSMSAIGNGVNWLGGTGTAKFLQAVAGPDVERYQGGADE